MMNSNNLFSKWWMVPKFFSPVVCSTKCSGKLDNETQLNDPRVLYRGSASSGTAAAFSSVPCFRRDFIVEVEEISIYISVILDENRNQTIWNQMYLYYFLFFSTLTIYSYRNLPFSISNVHLGISKA